MYCLLKLNGQTKWNALIANSAKTAFVNEDEGGDPIVPTQYGIAPSKMVIRNRGKKWEEGEGGARRDGDQGEPPIFRLTPKFF